MADVVSLSDAAKDFYDAPRSPLRSTESVQEVYPAPRVTSRDQREPEAGWPAPVLTLEREAVAQGWLTSKAWAHGCMPHATTGAPSVPRDSYSVTFGAPSGEWQGYAIYAAGSWQSIMVAGKRLPPFGALGRQELSAWLAEPEPEGAAFYDIVRARRAEQLANTKARAACNRGVHDQVAGMGDMYVCARCGNSWPFGGRPWRKSTGKGEAL
jgi:hypothetical protein